MEVKRVLSFFLIFVMLFALASCSDLARLLKEAGEALETVTASETGSESEPASPSETESESASGTGTASETGNASETDTASETETASETDAASESESASESGGSGIDVFDDPEGYNPIMNSVADIPPLLSSLQLFKSYDYDSVMDENGYPLATVSWEKLTLSSPAEINHPELAAVLNAINENTAIDAKNELANLAELGRNEPVADGDPYHANYELLVKRADEKALSILLRKTVADADGYHALYEGYVLSPDTGEVLPIEQMIVSEGALYDAFLREYDKQASPGYLADPRATFEKVIGENKLTWLLEPDGVVFYLSPGTYADPGDGLVKIALPFRDNRELYPGDVTEVAENYVVPFFQEETVRVPLDDGSDFTMDAWLSYDEYGVYYESMHVDIGEEPYVFETDGVDADFYFVKTPAHRLLVVNSVQAGTHGNFTIYTLDEGRPVFFADLTGESLSGAYYALDKYADCVFTDPTCFLLSSKIDNLSTYTGVRLFSFGEGVVPQPNDHTYLILCDFSLTVKKDTEFELLYSETRRPTGEKVVVKAGTVLSFVRTNRNSFVEMTDGEGLFVRVEMDEPLVMPPTLGGVPADEIFDGIMYAG